MYIMAPKRISKVYFINPSRVYPPIVARQRLGKTRYPGNEYTRSNRTIVGSVFYAVRVVSTESRRLVLPRTDCFSYYRQYTFIVCTVELHYNGLVGAKGCPF
jgi:hypothetical protein